MSKVAATPKRSASVTSKEKSTPKQNANVTLASESNDEDGDFYVDVDSLQVSARVSVNLTSAIHVFLD